LSGVADAVPAGGAATVCAWMLKDVASAEQASAVPIARKKWDFMITSCRENNWRQKAGFDRNE
jgi:hypothetical protein